MQELWLDSHNLVAAHENYNDFYECYIDRDYVLHDGTDIFSINTVNYDDPNNDHQIMDALEWEPSRFIQILPFTEEQAMNLRKAFVSSLPESPAKSKLSLSLGQSTPLLRRHACDLFDALIDHFREEGDAWLKFQEQAVIEYSKKWLLEKEVIAKVKPLRGPNGEHLGTYYRYGDEKRKKEYHPVPVIKKLDPDNENYLATCVQRIHINVIYVCRENWSDPDLNLRPDGLFFAHSNDLSNKSLFFYFHQDTYSQHKRALMRHCDSMYVLQASIPLIEQLSPLGILHYGLNSGEIFPVFEDLNQLRFQTKERGIDRLLTEGRINKEEHARLTSEVNSGVASVVLAF